MIPDTRFARVARRRALRLPLLAALTVGLSPTLASAQQDFGTPATLVVTTESEAAARSFWAGLSEFENIFFTTGAEHLSAAIAADAELGLAHVFYGFGAPGLTSAERRETIASGIAMMADATTAEVLFATAIKEWNAGNTDAAKAAILSAADMLPDDPHVAFFAAWIVGIGDNLTGAVAMREVTERFPDFAPAYNLLAYRLTAAGDEEGGLKAVRKYVELLPDHPNPHDSYAELLQWAGRLPDAKTEYETSIRLAPDYQVGYVGLAEIAFLMGNKEETYRQLNMAIEKAGVTQAQLNTRRALAAAYIMHNDYENASNNLQQVIDIATAREFNNIAATAYRQLAAVAAMRNLGSVTDHLARAAELGGDADAPAQKVWEATSYLILANPPKAREPAAALAAAAAEDSDWNTPSRVVNAWIAVQENNCTLAKNELLEADPNNNMVQVLAGMCYKMAGMKPQAEQFKSKVLYDARVNFFNPVTPIAYVQAQKI